MPRKESYPAAQRATELSGSIVNQAIDSTIEKINQDSSNLRSYRFC